MVRITSLFKSTFFLYFVLIIASAAFDYQDEENELQFHVGFDGCVHRIVNFFYDVLLKSEMPEDKTLEQIGDKDYCGLCQYGMKSLYQMLGDKNDEDKVRSTLQTIYWLMPKSVDDKCDIFFKNRTEKIADMIALNFTPNDVCMVWRLCDSKSQIKQKDNKSLDSTKSSQKLDYSYYSSKEFLEKYLHSNASCKTLSPFNIMLYVLAALSGFLIAILTSFLYKRLKKTKDDDGSKITSPILKSALNNSYYDKMPVLSEMDEELNL